METTKDQLQLTFIVVNITNGVNTGDASAVVLRINNNGIFIDLKPPFSDWAELGCEAK